MRWTTTENSTEPRYRFQTSVRSQSDNHADTPTTALRFTLAERFSCLVAPTCARDEKEKESVPRIPKHLTLMDVFSRLSTSLGRRAALRRRERCERNDAAREDAAHFPSGRLLIDSSARLLSEKLGLGERVASWLRHDADLCTVNDRDTYTLAKIRRPTKIDGTCLLAIASTANKTA